MGIKTLTRRNILCQLPKEATVTRDVMTLILN